ncbi:MAG: HNH endonuclease [Gammaproteobacteria bacterium]|nr:HNH endonuclease [Gammaproteobacteria bacterium]
MNVLERALIEKAGREHGWENVVESIEARVVLGSARHRGRTNVTAASGGNGWQVAFPDGRLVRELARSLPGLAGGGGFDAPDIERLAALLRRAAELSLALPDQAARTFRERAKNDLDRLADKGTEVERLLRQRVGQDVFREALLDYWGGACAVTGLALPDVLRASHAKPWADCTSDEERLDVFNGFLLVAHLDALFDRGLITFDAGGDMVIASQLASDHRALLHLDDAPRLRWLAPEHMPFLRWHREHVFRG